MEVDNAENVENVEKDVMEVMEVDTEVELDEEERPVPQVCRSIDFGTTWELSTSIRCSLIMNLDTRVMFVTDCGSRWT